METGLKILKNEKEYIEAKARLDGYTEEYRWILNTKEPLKDIKKQVSKLVERLGTKEMSLEEERKVLRRY